MTANRIKVSMPTQDSYTTCHPRMMDVSLPAPPFDIPATDRSETKPTLAPVRMDKLSAVDERWIRGALWKA